MNSEVTMVQPGTWFDSAQGNQTRREISDLLAEKKVNILIDCTDVEFMDSSGLSCLVMVLRNVRAAGGHLALCNINDQIQVLLELTTMTDVFKIVGDAEAFKQSFLHPAMS